MFAEGLLKSTLTPDGASVPFPSSSSAAAAMSESLPAVCHVLGLSEPMSAVAAHRALHCVDSASQPPEFSASDVRDHITYHLLDFC